MTFAERIARRNAIARMNGYYELPTVSAVEPLQAQPTVNTDGIDLHQHLEYIQSHNEPFVIWRNSIRGYTPRGGF